jgi:hypothetical protein
MSAGAEKYAEGTKVEESPSMINGSSGNKSNPGTVREAPSSDLKATGFQQRGEKKRLIYARMQSYCSRTRGGKERSKHNALKHGIFSEIVLLKNESPLEFNSFLKRLCNAFRPEGAVEELLGEKLASQ